MYISTITEEIEKYYRSDGRITTEWNANDIRGLKEAIDDRPEGGEVNCL